MQRLNLDHLGTFLKVIECGSFSAAADRLRLTQPAVSLQIRQLEKRLGAALIERVGRKAQPTAAGSELLRHAGLIDAAVTGAIDAVAHHTKNAIGPVRLGSGATASIFLLPPILSALRKRYPGLEINVTNGNTSDIVKAVEENLIDLALVTLPVTGRMLEVSPVMKDDFVAIAAPSMALPARLTAANLAKLPVLLPDTGANSRRIIDRWFTRNNATAHPAMSLGYVEAIKAMVAAGLGCGILPESALRKEERARFVLRPLTPPLRRQLGVVIRRDKRLTRGLKATYDALLRLR